MPAKVRRIMDKNCCIKMGMYMDFQFSYSSFLLQKGNSEIFIKCFSQWTLNAIILITFLNV